MLIGGEWVDAAADEWIDVENPAVKSPIARVPRGRKADVDAAVAAAKRAYPGWWGKSAAERAAALLAIADLAEANEDHLARTISLENGNALRTQSRGEAASIAQTFRYCAGLARELKGTSPYLSDRTLDYTRREPYGVVGAITPWNAPLQIAALKIAPAIVTGNALVLKVSEDAPLNVIELAQLCHQVLPPGVLNIVTGYGIEAGAPLAEHPHVRKVSFTGSTDVGRSIMRAAAQRIAAVSLELGGKSPQIVLPEVDLDFAAQGAITAMRFSRQGQSCTAGSRLFVHDSIADSFIEKLTTKLTEMRIGDPLDEQTDMGTIVNKKQFDRVSGYVGQAIERKPEALVLGGLPPTEGALAQGYYFQPTVFVNLPDDTPMCHEEVFGPVLSISTWRDEDEVIRRANDSEYGLAGFVWGRDGAATIRIAHALEVGWVLVNQGGGQQIGHSYGGMKQSGIGREHSLEGMMEMYTDIKQVSVDLGNHVSN